MVYKLAKFLIVTALFHVSIQNSKDEDPMNDLSAFADMASSLLKGQSAESMGNILGSLMQSEGGKQLGNMLMGMGDNKNGGFDPSIIANVLGALNSANAGGDNKKGSESNDLLSTFFNVLSENGGMESVMTYLPLLTNTINSFTGDAAQKINDDHAGHSWMMPPIIEKIHVAFDHFIHSESGKALLELVGTEKFIKVFADADGKFNMGKFLQLLENHSFRKHWIELVTRKIAVFISYFANPKMQTQFLTTMQYFVNTALKSQGFPKAAMFDSTRPSETITAFINYGFKNYFNYKVSAKQYVKPALKYIQELFKLAQNQGLFAGKIDSTELSHKLADTINLEIIEPVARVYRAHRFVKKNPKCDKYVMCLVNQEEPHETQSLPGLKSGLSKASSLFSSWFLSDHTGTSFWSLYQMITEQTNCKSTYLEACNEFHLEEEHVTKEYVHNEL